MSYRSEQDRVERQAAAREVKAAAEPLHELPNRGPKEWAWRLRDRELAGEILPKSTRALWRAVLPPEASKL